MLTDTHCHLFYEELKNDLSNVLSRANEMNVTRFICVGTNIIDSSTKEEPKARFTMASSPIDPNA